MLCGLLGRSTRPTPILEDQQIKDVIYAVFGVPIKIKNPALLRQRDSEKDHVVVCSSHQKLNLKLMDNIFTLVVRECKRIMTKFLYHNSLIPVDSFVRGWMGRLDRLQRYLEDPDSDVLRGNHCDACSIERIGSTPQYLTDLLAGLIHDQESACQTVGSVGPLIRVIEAMADCHGVEASTIRMDSVVIRKKLAAYHERVSSRSNERPCSAGQQRATTNTQAPKVYEKQVGRYGYAQKMTVKIPSNVKGAQRTASTQGMTVTVPGSFPSEQRYHQQPAPSMHDVSNPDDLGVYYESRQPGTCRSQVRYRDGQVSPCSPRPANWQAAPVSPIENIERNCRDAQECRGIRRKKVPARGGERGGSSSGFVEISSAPVEYQGNWI